MVLLLLPAFVWLPETVAVTVNPVGRPAVVKLSAVSAVPSYTLLADAAVRVTAVSFAVISSVPSSSVTV